MEPLPEWVKKIHPHQIDAVEEIVRAFENVDVVIVDGPPGTGKTLIAELVRRAMGVSKTTYICNNKALQDQFVRDFNYSKVLKGRANYPTEHDRLKNCDECTSSSVDDICWYCDSKATCPYQIAKDDALSSELAVVNTSYFLAEANYVGGFGRRDLAILDEADTMEGILSGFVQFRVPKWILHDVRMQAPKKGTRRGKLIEWLTELRGAVIELLAKNRENWEPKKNRSVKQFVEDIARVVEELKIEVQAKIDAGDTVNKDEALDEARSALWIRDYDSDTKSKDDADDIGPFILKPVKVDSYGIRYLWRHGKKWLVMSGSIISPDEIIDSLGCDLTWQLVKVPMTYPVENRPIYFAPIADLTWSSKEAELPKLIAGIKRILDKHPNEKVLVHTVSYWMAKSIAWELKEYNRSRGIYTYQTSLDSAEALRKYSKSRAGVLLAPSMDRGVDFRDDLCRVVVVAKVPYMSLGDRVVSNRLWLPGGKTWYAVQTIRTIVQMTGRGVRSEQDYATTYILDKQFGKLWRENKSLFPEWWREAMDFKQDVRWLYR